MHIALHNTRIGARKFYMIWPSDFKIVIHTKLIAIFSAYNLLKSFEIGIGTVV